MRGLEGPGVPSGKSQGLMHKCGEKGQPAQTEQPGDAASGARFA